jgi:hypothetical protein
MPQSFGTYIRLINPLCNAVPILHPTMPHSLLRRACPAPSDLLFHDFNPAEIDPVTLAERQGSSLRTWEGLEAKENNADLHQNPPIST